MSLAWFPINPYTPRDFNTVYLDAKSIPVLAIGGLCQKNNNRGKYSATPSLKKGCPSSEVPVSRMSKLHTAKTD